MSDNNTLINLTGFTDGISSAESGINVKEMKIEIEPEHETFIPDTFGNARGCIQGAMKMGLAISGEIVLASSALAGLMTSVLGTGVTIANTLAYFGAPTTGKYLSKGTVTYSRENGTPQMVDLAFWSRKGIT